jgi:hypothetical protein
MTPLGAVFTLIFSAGVFCLPRRAATVAIIAGVCYVTQGQVLDVGFHFTAIRLALLAGLIRVVARGELRSLQPNAMDRALLAYALVVTVIPVIRSGTVDELVYQVGCLYNILLFYFVLRCLIKDKEDVRAVLARLAFVIIPFALLMMLESMTERNLFSVFGGVSESSMIRDGHVRSEGAFRSPITAGAFGATFAMLFAGMLFAKSERRNATVGLVASIVIVVCAHSSGPLLGLMFGLIGLICWNFRHYMRHIRWGIVLSLVALSMVMKAPVWFLMGRISDVVGGGGYDRAEVVDAFVKHFDSWWLLGTSSTGGWVATELSFGGTDLTNQFVADGVNGGLLGLILSVALVVRCFQRVGRSIRQIEGSNPNEQKFIWGLGSALLGSVVIIFSVTYFDQMQVVWYFLLSCIACELVPNQAFSVAPADVEDASTAPAAVREAEGCSPAVTSKTLSI